MQGVDDGEGHQDFLGLELMRKIKNDPKSYLRRSDFASPTGGEGDGDVGRVSRTRGKAFLTVPIDDGFYIDFRAKRGPSKVGRRHDKM
jgi:hypothetical protein